MYSTRKTLIDRLRSKSDDDSWQVFSDTYQKYIYVVIRRMNIQHAEAEDLVQEVLIKVWNKLGDFDYNPGKSKFRSWLNTVIRNNVLNYIKSRKSYSQKEWENYIANLALERIKHHFSGKAIEVFEMSLGGASVQEIAAKLDIKENTAYRLKNRVKSKIVEEIEQLRYDLE